MRDRMKKAVKTGKGTGYPAAQREQPAVTPRKSPTGTEQILRLQRAAGNRAVRELFNSSDFQRTHQPDVLHNRLTPGISTIPPCPRIQLSPLYKKGDKVVLKLKTLRMATEPGGNVLAALLKEGDLLELGDAYRYGGGNVFYATVVKSGDEKNNGKTGIVRTDWIRHEAEAAPPAAAKAPAPSGPTVASYVDNFKEVIYDPDYRLEEGSPTNWMQVIYDDGTAIDINVYSFDEIASGSDTGDSLARGRIGIGGRFFPLRMNRFTTPRLWAARQDALDVAASCTIDLMRLSLPAVIFIITVPPMVVGRPPNATLRANRTSVPRTAGRRPPTPAPVAAGKEILKGKLRELLASGKVEPGGVEANGVYFGAMNVFKAGKQLVARFDMIENVSRIANRGKEMLKVFEEAAMEIAKESNSESVRVVVGTVQNSEFAQALQAAGYQFETEIAIGWTKIISF